MKEIVQSIIERENVPVECKGLRGLSYTNLCDGYEVITDQHKYLLLIDNDQCCCEYWGYFVTNETDIGRYVGKELAEVRLTNTALDTVKLENKGLGKEEIQFVDFCFADGDVLQLAVYNSHNGYYGHGIYFIKDDVKLLDGCL